MAGPTISNNNSARSKACWYDRWDRRGPTGVFDGRKTSAEDKEEVNDPPDSQNYGGAGSSDLAEVEKRSLRIGKVTFLLIR